MGHFLQDGVFYTWQGNAPIQQGISSIWLPKHDLKNDTNWHINGDGGGMSPGFTPRGNDTDN